jgi:hypothetical protein
VETDIAVEPQVAVIAPLAIEDESDTALASVTHMKRVN